MTVTTLSINHCYRLHYNSPQRGRDTVRDDVVHTVMVDGGFKNSNLPSMLSISPVGRTA